MTTEHILGLLPHRYPFLLIARVLEISDDRVPGAQERDDQRATLPGPLPEGAGDAGVLQIDAMAQAGGILACGGEASTGRVRNCTRRPCSRSR
jgi:UDP-3-O-[3-hydroxymyristoyl] N-acetylglucosamine deacetylase/3-hydroxyacyl-[acyl-carrier-protein] dehydratase